MSFLVYLSENVKKILSFMKFFVAQTSRTRFFFNCWKVKYLHHLKLNHPNFAVNLPVIFIFKFCRKEIYTNHQENLENWICWISTMGTSKLKFDMDSISLLSTKSWNILSYLIIMYLWVHGYIIQTI